MAVMEKQDFQTLVHSAQAFKNDLHLLITSLKRRQLNGAQRCARATLEIIRAMLGKVSFPSAEQMMRGVKALGRELCAAAPSEFAIGNLVRRVLFFIREEYHNCLRGQAEVASGRAASGSFSASLPAGDVMLSPAKDAADAVLAATSVNSAKKLNRDISHSLDAMFSSFGGKGGDEDDFSRHFPGLKSAVIAAINELNNEIDNLSAISQRAQDYIHSDETILTFGYSKLVEMFLAAAASKRRFQLIIAEGEPGLEGHKLAQNLPKYQSISITVIADSNLYALMGRINKVLLSPEAIMADGGAISASGHYMVAIAAKEFSVPVVCISPAFAITPLFAHNQSTALQQLLSPSHILPYNASVNFANVEVSNPAFDHLPPDLVSLYVTNDGSQLPSYVFRQLSEYYHPRDYII